MPTAAELHAALTGPHPRRALGRAITLLESTRPADRRLAAQLLDRVLDDGRPTFRLGISGTPGVGKSTFVEAFGLELIERGHRLAVLAVDPSSALSGGSILGDKTRMEQLSRHPRAFVRPSPNAGSHGGVGAATRAAVACCEAAGYDFILVETVGVGQAEWRVHGMTDAFLLLAQPASGDDLQGIKRGILELADHLVVNKADLLPEQAKLAADELRHGLHLAPPRPDGWTVEVALASALTGEGIGAVADRISTLRSHLLGADAGAEGSEESSATNRLLATRRHQQTAWLHEQAEARLLADFRTFLDQRREHSDDWRELLDEHPSLYGAAAVLLADFYRTNQA